MLTIEQTERWEIMQADMAAQKVRALNGQGKLRERQKEGRKEGRKEGNI